MRIAYLLDEDISAPTGVVNKILCQTGYWTRNGHDVKVICLRSRTETACIDGAEILSLYKRANAAIKFIQRIGIALELRRVLDDYRPDLCYMRYMLYSPFLVSSIRRMCKHVMEINTDDISESRLTTKWNYYYNLLTRNRLLCAASGIVAVTNELAQSESLRRVNCPRIVIPNGIDLNTITHIRKSKERSDDKMNLCFVGSPGLSWHGIDKIATIVNHLKGVRFHLVGITGDQLMSVGIRENDQDVVRTYGFVSQDRAQEIVAMCDIGISTLALHRKGMHQACPLKSRQYLAQGLPIIVGYDDPDISRAAVPDFVLNIGNYERNVIDNIRRIQEFVCRVRDYPAEVITQFAREVVSMEKKEKVRLAYFCDIAEGN